MQAVDISLDFAYNLVDDVEVKKLMPRRVDDYFSLFRKESISQVQHKLTCAAHKSIFSALVNLFGPDTNGKIKDEFNYVRINNVSARAAGVWKNVIPSETLLKCKDHQYRINSRIMLGL